MHLVVAEAFDDMDLGMLSVNIRLRILLILSSRICRGLLVIRE